MVNLSSISLKIFDTIGNMYMMINLELIIIMLLMIRAVHNQLFFVPQILEESLEQSHSDHAQA